MTTLRKYVDVVKAEMDKSLLESAGIPAFVAGENSASIGYGSILAEVHLQVQDADVDRARQVLQDNKEATPLSDDFIPPAAPSLPDDSIPKAASPEQDLETAGSDTRRAVVSAVVTLVFPLAMFAAFTWWKNSHGPTAYFRSGLTKRAKGDLDGALVDYNKAIELNPQYAYAYNNRGLIKQAKGDLSGAITDFDKAVELDPKDSQAYYNRGIVRRDKGDLEGAITDYDEAIKLNPQYAHAYNNRGCAKQVKGDLDNVLLDFDRAIELDPKDVHAYRNRGLARRVKGNLDGAITDYDQAIILDSKDVSTYDGRADAKRMKGDLDSALSDYNRVIELDPKNINALYGRGVVHYNKRDWNNALLDFRKVSLQKPLTSKSESMPDYSHIRIWMARAKLGERIAATDELKQYLLSRTTGKPGDWPQTIARFLTGDISESDFLKAADSGDEKHLRNQKCEAYFYAGTLRLIDGDKFTAADYFTKCLETGATRNYEYQSAAAELEALKQ
jgi:tetratricopeptide (TPR) repeat protein